MLYYNHDEENETFKPSRSKFTATWSPSYNVKKTLHQKAEA